MDEPGHAHQRRRLEHRRGARAGRRTVAAASLFVDRRESTVNESGDYLCAASKARSRDHIQAELGEMLTGAAEGRKSESEITLFKSLGLAVEDLASAAFLYENARRNGRGSWVEF